MGLILFSFLISVGINLVMFLPAYFFKTDKLTDMSYAITFIVVSLFSYLISSKSLAQTLCLIMITLWTIRLGTFLFIRIRHIKRDTRFDGMRDIFYKFFSFWLLQGITVSLVLIPSVLLWGNNDTKIDAISLLGIVVFITGLLLESIADFQKYQFNKNRPKTWIDKGVWRISRHPNYLGEILLWLGIYIFVAPSIDTSQRLLALIGPIYIAVILIFVSGIPILEKASNNKWANRKSYRQYKSQVPPLIPSFSSIRRLFNSNSS